VAKILSTDCTDYTDGKQVRHETPSVNPLR
jgi:hypothetical protein